MGRRGKALDVRHTEPQGSVSSSPSSFDETTPVSDMALLDLAREETGAPSEVEPWAVMASGDANDVAGAVTASTCEEDVLTAVDSEQRLALGLAELLRAQYPSGVAFGALASAEVRNALRESMRAAGVKCFKPKFLHRFPAVLIYDGKLVRAAQIADAAAAGEAHLARDRGIAQTADEGAGLVIHSCLRKNDNGLGSASRTAAVDGVEIQTHVNWTKAYDLLTFKPGTAPAAVVNGRHVKRLMVDSSDVQAQANICAKGGKGCLSRLTKTAWVSRAEAQHEEDSDSAEVALAASGTELSVERIDHNIVEEAQDGIDFFSMVDCQNVEDEEENKEEEDKEEERLSWGWQTTDPA